MLTILIWVVGAAAATGERPLVDLKIFFGPPTPSTSKFPPLIELIVQRVQAQFSTYVYEDLSRPATYEKPVYTLSPEEQATVTLPAQQSTTRSSLELVEEEAEEQGLAEENEVVAKPVQYGTLVVYLKNATAVKSSADEGRVADASADHKGKGSPLMTAVLDIKVMVPSNDSRISNVTLFGDG